MRTVYEVKHLVGGVLFKVDRQQLQQLLSLGTQHGEAAVPELLLHCCEIDRAVCHSPPQDKAELSG